MEAQVQFETAPEVVSGIELSSNGQKVAWSIADYLATLEKSGELHEHSYGHPPHQPASEAAGTRRSQADH